MGLLLSDAFAKTAPFLALSTLLMFFSFSHDDDIDALYYKSIAANIRVTGDWFRLVWPQLPDLTFNDHIAPGFWLIALSEQWLGDIGTRLFYSALTIGTFVLLFQLAKRFALGRSAILAVWVAVFTENFVRMQAQPRLDPPFLLLWMGSLFVAASFSPVLALASGLLAGSSALFRAPPSLALLILVPALVLVRRRLEAKRLTPRDAVALLVFVLAFLTPLALFQIADSHFSRGDAIHRYFFSQVLPSLQGTRSDGHNSHFAPLRSIAGRFWPGLLFCLAAVWFMIKSWKDVPLFLRYNLLTIALVVLGFSLGRRHVFTHIWPAYPALFMIAGWGWERTNEFIAALRSKGTRAATLLPALGWASMIPFGALLMSIAPRCDVDVAKKIVESPSICEVVLIATADDSKDWFTANRVVDHCRKSILFAPSFLVPIDPRINTLCTPLAFASNRSVPPTSWKLLSRGSELSLYELSR